MAEMGFRESSSRRRAPKKTALVYKHVFKDIIPGDAAVAIERVLQASKLDFDEIATPSRNGMTGAPEETAFVRHQSEGLEIPFGTYRIEKLGDVTTSLASGYSGAPALQVAGVLLDSKSRDVWMEFLKSVEDEVLKFSIFRGRPLIVEQLEDLLVPRLMKLDETVEVILRPELEEELETTLYYPLQNRDLCRAHGIRTRRGIILEGHYGAGKSLIMYHVAQVAQKSGWGVLHISSRMLGGGMVLAPRMEPVCIIVEDVDASTHGDRDSLNTLLNAISSVATKSTGDYMLVVSTNFLDRIDPALLRPERIDAIVKVELPDEPTVERIIRVFSKGRLQANINLGEVNQALAGTTPAIICEVVQRALIDGLRKGKPISVASLMFHTGRMDKQRALATPVLKQDSQGERLAKELYGVVHGE